MSGMTADELPCEDLLLPRASYAIDLKLARRSESAPAGPDDDVATDEIRIEGLRLCPGEADE